ncbi:MAG: MliC family protein [bacterium]
MARGCRTASSSPLIGALTGTTYTCAGGVTVSAAYGGSTAIVTFLGNTHRLVQVPLVEGSRYTDGRFTWTLSRSQEGTLVHDGAVIARECRTAASSQVTGTTYTCAGGMAVIATVNGSIATVTFQGNTYRLVQVPLAEGSRYTDGRFTWTVSRGEEGTLTRFGAVVARECRKDTFQPREPER